VGPGGDGDRSGAVEDGPIQSHSLPEDGASQAGEAGLGFFVDESGKTDRFGHRGADEGFQAFLEAYAATGRGAAIMMNSDNAFSAIQPLVDSIAREYAWPGHTARPA
jgi:hypothetical protein